MLAAQGGAKRDVAGYETKKSNVCMIFTTLCHFYEKSRRGDGLEAEAGESGELLDLAEQALCRCLSGCAGAGAGICDDAVAAVFLGQVERTIGFRDQVLGLCLDTAVVALSKGFEHRQAD